MTSTLTPWHTTLATAQAGVDAAREELHRAREARASVVAAARASGESIYGIAKALGLSQAAVRKLLGLCS